MPRYGFTRTFFCAFLTSALLLTSCATGDSPRQSLSELRRALLNHDADLALRYVDVDSVADGLVDDILLKYKAKADNPLAVLGLSVGKEMAGLVMPGVKALVRSQVRAAIESNDELGYFEDIRKTSVWYLSIKTDGETAMVRPRGKPGMGFRMARAGEGRWKIIRIVRGSV